MACDVLVEVDKLMVQLKYQVVKKSTNAEVTRNICQKVLTRGGRGGRGVDNGMGPLPKSPAGLQLAKSGAAVGNCPGRKR